MGDNKKITVTSNGMFAENDNLTKEILKRNMLVQITHDKRYYPQKIKYIKNDNLYYVDNIATMINLGRAKVNGYRTINRIAPPCFNMLSIIKSGKATNLKEANSILENMGKYCSLVVQYDGQIRIGESVECNIIGNVLNDSIYSAFNNSLKINSNTCNKCGLMNKLTPYLKLQIDK